MKFITLIILFGLFFKSKQSETGFDDSETGLDDYNTDDYDPDDKAVIHDPTKEEVKKIVDDWFQFKEDHGILFYTNNSIN